MFQLELVEIGSFPGLDEAAKDFYFTMIWQFLAYPDISWAKIPRYPLSIWSFSISTTNVIIIDP